MLQEAVDALFDNGARRVITGPNNRPPSPFRDTLKASGALPAEPAWQAR